MEKEIQRIPQMAMSTQYFLYFGVLGVFLPYFNLYCYHLGFTGFQIGTLSAVRSVTGAFFPLLWGLLADRFNCRRPIYIGCNIISMIIWSFYFHTTNFWAMLIIAVFYGIFYAPIISFLEAATMDALGTAKSQYGRIRLWGSLSFILAVMGIGKLTDLYTTRIILICIFTGSLLQSACSVAIPGSGKAPLPATRPESPKFLTRNMVAFLICGFLMLVSHSTYYAFFSIHMETIGCSKSTIGLAWGIAVVAEIIVMFNSEKFFRRFTLETVLFYSFIITALRWLALFAFASPVVIMLSQIAHAISYGTFHMASILYMDRLSPEKAKTLGQAINNAVTYGLGLMVGFFISGALYETTGTRFLFLMSAGVALGGGFLFKYVWLTEKRRMDPDEM